MQGIIDSQEAAEGLPATEDVFAGKEDVDSFNCRKALEAIAPLLAGGNLTAL